MQTLREWRQRQCLSQEQVADKLSKLAKKKIRQSSVSQWESGMVPNAIIGGLITKMTEGAVKAASFGKVKK